MTLAEFIQAARLYFGDLRQHFTPEAVALQREREALCLQHRLCRSYHDLLRRRNAMQSLQARIGHDEKRAAALTCQVESCMQMGDCGGAYRHALELDLVRSNLDAERAQARQREEEYRRQVENIAALEQHRDEIESRLAAPLLRPASLDS